MTTPLRNKPEGLIEPARKHMRHKHRLHGRREHDVSFAGAVASQQPKQQDVALLIDRCLQHGKISTLSVGGAGHYEAAFGNIEGPVWKAG